MNNEQRIVELLAEVLHKVDALSGEMNGVKGEIRGMKDDVKGLKDDVKGLKDDVKDLKDNVKDLSKRMTGVEKNIVKLNIIGAENSRAILKLADNSERRITRLEKAVFK